MPCMKCGKDTEDGQVFCAHCREVMESYPVKPDVHIKLPNHAVATTLKKPVGKSGTRKKDQRAEPLQRQIRWMWGIIIVLLLAVAVLAAQSVLTP